MPGGLARPSVDVVVVAYASHTTLRACIEPLVDVPGVSVTVVDNDSPTDDLGTVSDLRIRAIRTGRNGGFSFGCNTGARAGGSEFILFLNPDAVLAPADLAALAAVLREDPETAVVGPRLLGGEGELLHSQRRAPRLRSTLAQALFLHRLAPRASWTDELVREPARYSEPGEPAWLSGACLLVRRSAFEEAGGFDEGFFMYCEDADLCVRLRAAGYRVRYEPLATARHQEGSSAPRSDLMAIHASSRRRYARLHYGRPAAGVETVLIGLLSLTHALVAVPRRRSAARGHAAALRALTRRVAA